MNVGIIHYSVEDADLFFYCAKNIQTNTNWGECRVRVDEGSLVEFVKISIGDASLQEK